MTRQEFHNEVKCNPDYLGWHNVHELADKLFDEIEGDDLSIAYMAGFYKGQDSIKDQNCNGCIHKPKEGENYPIECGTCCRWYGDGYEKNFTV